MPRQLAFPKRRESGCATTIASTTAPAFRIPNQMIELKPANSGTPMFDEKLRLPQPVDALAPHPAEERDAENEKKDRTRADEPAASPGGMRHPAQRRELRGRRGLEPRLGHHEREENAERDQDDAARDDRQPEVDERKPDRRADPEQAEHTRDLGAALVLATEALPRRLRRRARRRSRRS